VRCSVSFMLSCGEGANYHGNNKVAYLLWSGDGHIERGSPSNPEGCVLIVGVLITHGDSFQRDTDREAG
jgi:hypothetical protein